MSKRIFYDMEPNKNLNAVVLDIPDWEGFDKLIQFVKKYYDAEVISKADGPGARCWILSSKGQKFKLVHDDGYGNYFEPLTKNDEPIVLEICRDLEERLAKI
jgi:hypothetical protein